MVTAVRTASKGATGMITTAAANKSDSARLAKRPERWPAQVSLLDVDGQGLSEADALGYD